MLRRVRALDLEMGCNVVQELKDSGHLALGQEIDLKVEMSPFVALA